jgi:hypothetical protein
MVVLDQGFVSSLKTITLARVRNKQLPEIANNIWKTRRFALLKCLDREKYYPT